MRLRLSAATAAALILVANPALAHDGAHDGHAMPDPREMPAPYPGGPRHGGYDPAARDAWLADCRHRLSSRDSGVGGAVIGGVVGGIAGNRIAGRHNRTVGTIAGAAVGAVAGAAIDKAEDAGRNRDECEAYLDDYHARYEQGGGYPGYGSGYGYGYPQGYYPAYGYPAQGCCMAQPMMAVPMMMVPIVQAQPHCTETVEYVYEDVPVRPAPRKRYIPKTTKIVPDKRVKVVPIK
ncbi:Glycine zipper 2TM domain-containing protein [Novosphingobium sp. CF614]|uniref:glycine zipper 2TM domain-containing protein n=1 Tax=Novosphingobium sp. CF614 TaxID=1884364 RepID=UPI0008EA701A|nr:glycine zipper 2TM domain-containing protein [Novosphingobium sp. CF614]SFF78462.1 Glycine zipper 2TM domain-containing protein [Novosphingobium sp. CF614]